MSLKFAACAILLAVLVESAPPYYFQGDAVIPGEVAPGNRRVRAYDYVALYPDYAYSGASSVANTGYYPYPYQPYGGGSSASSSAAAYGGRGALPPYLGGALQPYLGGANAASHASAATQGFRNTASAAAAAASGYY